MLATLITSRICACGCDRRFTPNPSRPGTEYCYGHKPKVKVAVGATAQPARDKERALLDYRLTAATLRREIAGLEEDIDLLDLTIEGARTALAELQAGKDRVVDRHLVAMTALETLEALIAGRSLASLVGAVEGA